jgi:hypothetical protein
LGEEGKQNTAFRLQTGYYVVCSPGGWKNRRWIWPNQKVFLDVKPGESLIQDYRSMVVKLASRKSGRFRFE